MTKLTLFLATVSFALATSSNAAEDLPKATIGRTPTHVFDNTIYLSGMRAPGDFKVFVALRVDTVIDLSGTADRHAIEQAGLRYVHVPLEEDFPTRLDALEPVMKSLVNASGDHRVLVCDDDGEETGAVWALYLALTDGVAADTALDEGRSIGLADRGLVERVRNLMTTGSARH
jgi:hypothetical protein